MWFHCIKRCNILASNHAIREEDRIGDSRDISKEGDQERRVANQESPLEEREDGNWEIDDEYLEAN